MEPVPWPLSASVLLLALAVIAIACWPVGRPK
jgi:hypothetical protein